MWSFAYTVVTDNVSAEQVWREYVSVETWPLWDIHLLRCELIGPFTVGSKTRIKPKGGMPTSVGIITLCEPNKRFADSTTLPLAKLVFDHVLEQRPAGLAITHSVTISGPLAFFWKRIIGKNVSKQLPGVMERLVNRAAGQRES